MDDAHRGIEAEATRRATGAGRQLSVTMPRLILEARRVAATVIHGLHGRRRAGTGENFWQFRRFMSGEPSARVDWRRSARDDHLYVREREWEAAHTVWIWPDSSPSMVFASALVWETKLDRALGLDHPLIVQYWHWLTQAVQGNLGVSYFTQIPVSQSISQRLPVDLSIALLAVLLAVFIGGTAGTVAAMRRGGWVDRAVTIACSAVSTLPAFVIGIILVVLFAVTVHWLPANGYVGPSTSIPQWLRFAILPSLALSLQVSADIARQLRTSLVEVLDRNYIVGAKVRGLSYRRILIRHALRNAAGPALTVLGYDFPQMLAGAVAADQLIILSNVPGLLRQFPDESTLIRHIDKARVEQSLDFAEGRMKKKVLGASEALGLGVRQVVFGDGRTQTPVANALAGEGTVIS